MQAGRFAWSGRKFRTTAADLDRLWESIPPGAALTVVMEPTRNAWVPLAAWFRRRGATVIMVPPEQSADLRDYYSKHAKSDRLDSRMLARLPLLHPDGLRPAEGPGPRGSAAPRDEAARQPGQAPQRDRGPARQLPGAARTAMARGVRRGPGPEHAAAVPGRRLTPTRTPCAGSAKPG